MVPAQSGLQREATIGAPYTVTLGAATTNGNAWEASITATLDSPLVVTGTDSPYNQILLSNFPLYYDYSEGIRSFQVTITLLNATAVLAPTGAAESTIHLTIPAVAATLNLRDLAPSSVEPPADPSVTP